MLTMMHTTTAGYSMAGCSEPTRRNECVCGVNLKVNLLIAHGKPPIPTRTAQIQIAVATFMGLTTRNLTVCREFR
jgi:hypothetical protein